MDKISIINMALGHLGEASIESFDDKSTAATSASTVYDSARRSTLRAYYWSFATSVISLAKTAATEIDYEYAYALPSDCLKAVKLVNSMSGQFVIRQKKLLTNEATVNLEYIKDITDEKLFDSSFVEAFSYLLASKLAIPVAGKPELMQTYHNAYTQYISNAAAQNLREQRRDEQEENRYVQARR